MRQIQERNIAVSIILSVVTCGIYSIYWYITLTDDVNALCDDDYKTSGGMAFVFYFITCGIYGWYWAYKMGEKCDKIKGVGPAGNSNVLYLILSIFSLGIINYCLIQDTINKKIMENNAY